MFIRLYCCLFVRVQPLCLAWADLHHTDSLWALFQGLIVEFRLGYPIFYLGTSEIFPPNNIYFGHLLFLGHFGPLQSLRSTLVHLVHSVHFGQSLFLWSILVHYSTSVPQVQFSPFSPFAPLGPLWSRRSSPFGPLQSISSTMLNPVHFGPIQTIFQRTWSFWSSLVHFVHFSLLFPNRHLAVLSMHELC